MFIIDASSSTRHVCHCSMIWQLMNRCPYLSQIERVSPKPGASATTGNLIFETEAGAVGKGEYRTADWPVN